VIEHAGELSPARKKNVIEFADQARSAKELATMRRDLDVDCDPSELVLRPPDRATLRETFRRFEFRNLLNRIDELEHGPYPAGARADRGHESGLVRGAMPQGPMPQGLTQGHVSVGRSGRRFAAATDAGVVVGPWSDADAHGSATRRSSRTTSRRCRG